MDLAELKKTSPAYADLSDEEFAYKVWNKYYSDQVSMEDFAGRVNLPAESVSKMQAFAEPSAASEQPISALPSEEVSPYAEMGAGEVAREAITNIPSSAMQYGAGLYEAVSDPVGTASTIMKTLAGGLQNILPESVVKAIGEVPEEREMANAVADFYAQRYGSMAGFKEAVATDPVGVLADLSGALTAAGAVTRVPGLARAGSLTDPTAIAGRVIGAAGRGAATGLGVTTGVGGEAIQQAYRAGREGGETSRLFREQMRGNATMEDVLSSVKQDLAAMRQQRNQLYQQDMRAVKADKTELSFDGIDKMLTKRTEDLYFAGQPKNAKAAETMQNVTQVIEDWKSLDPAVYRTPMGLDALKQRVGSILEDLPFEQKEARRAVQGVYNSIGKTITKQAPVYANVMKEYSEASDTITQIEKTLSQNPNAAIDTQLRKLQSIMRNNVNTSYGYRQKLVEQLEEAGGKAIQPQLAGQAMGDLAPRGIQRGVAGLTGAGGYMLGGVPAMVATGLASSPRVVGESAYALGRAASVPSKAGELLERTNIPGVRSLPVAFTQPGILNLLAISGREYE